MANGTLASLASAESPGPLKLFEAIAEEREWPYEWRSDCELAALAPGKWDDYQFFLSWNKELEAVHITCSTGIRTEQARHQTFSVLVCLINEKLWLGHFGIWEEDGIIMFRHALPIRGMKTLSREALEDIADMAVSECERFYPAIQYVLWGRKAPKEALEAALVETVGEA